MAHAEKKSDVLRIRIEPEKKEMLARAYKKRGTSISREVRSFLDGELMSLSDPLDRFDSIMSSADAKADAYGAPEPTIEDIVSYVEKAREERMLNEAVSA